jgi:nucleoside-diphosphate-sugar epimerase
MKILVVGGTQFLGHHITRALLGQGHAVTLLHRGGHRSEFAAKAQEVLCDWHDAPKVREALKGRSFDAVVHCICFSEAEAEHSVALFKDRCGHFIYLSTAALYLMDPDNPPPFREEDALREPSPLYAESEKYSYGVNKRKADLLFLIKHRRTGFPATILRLPVAVGPRDYTGRLDAYLHRVLDGKPLILPDGGMNAWGFLAAEDLARTVERILGLKKTFGRAFNLAQREAVSLRTLVLAMGQLLGRPVHSVDIPGSMLMRTPLGLGFSPLSSAHHVLLNCSAARRDFAFDPTPFPAWLKAYVEDFQRSRPRDLFRSTRPLEITLARQYLKMRLTV